MTIVVERSPGLGAVGDGK